MFYFFYGTNTAESRKNAKAILSALGKKRPEAQYFRVTAESWDEELLKSYIKGQGLFESKMIVFADKISENKEAKEWM
jgi:hypothetical protein